MPLSESRKGQLYILAEAVLWGLFPVITRLTYSSIGPLASAAFGVLLAAVFFGVMLFIRRRWSDVRQWDVWPDILRATFLIGVLLYACWYIGLQYTTAGNASIMALMEVFFSFLILGVFLKHEPIVARQIVGAFCMVVGALLILVRGPLGWQNGDLLIVLGTIFAPMGNYYAQRARTRVSSECIMFIRSLISGLVLLLLMFLFEGVPSRAALTSNWWLLLLNGTVIMGYSKILWTEGIHRIPINVAISLASIAPLFTLATAYFFLSERVTVVQIASLLPITAGVVLLTKQNERKAE